MAITLDQFFDMLDAETGPLSLGLLRRALTDLVIQPSDVASFIRFSERTYSRNLLRAGDAYHALVLCWQSGQRSPIHDHRGSACAVRVLEGTMTETLFAFAPTGQVMPTSSRDLIPGTVVASADMDIHQVSNLQPPRSRLVTLHVYSPPLLTMGTYSLTDAQRGEEPMFLDFCDSAGI